LLVILKVLKTEVNWSESLADKRTAMIAGDSQGRFVKGIGTNGEVSMLESTSSLALQGLLREMQMLVRQSKYNFIDSSPSP